MKRFKKAIKIIAIIVVIVFLGFPVTLFYVDYFPYMYEQYSWEKDSEDPDMVKFQSPFYDFLSFFAVRSREFFYRYIMEHTLACCIWDGWPENRQPRFQDWLL